MKRNETAQPSTFEATVGYLRSALHYLYDPVSLRRSPLIPLLGLEGEFDSAAALQRRLTDAIQSLKPALDEPPQSTAWRIYDLLSLQYIRQFPRTTVANQLGISERQLRREQRLALEALAQLILSDIPKATGAPEPPPAQQKEKTLREELGWLTTASSDPRMPLEGLLDTVTGLVQPLANTLHVQLETEIEPGLSETLVAHQAIRHILLTILSDVLPQAQGGKVTIRAVRHEPNLEVHIYFIPNDTHLRSTLAQEPGLKAADTLAGLSGASLARTQHGQQQCVTLTFLAPETIPVLVIDDNADWLDMLKRFIVGSNYRIIATRAPETACDLARKTQPAVILLDVMLPGLDGWQVFSELRNEQTLQRTPIVVCTVLPLEELARSLGVDAFLQKPVTQSQFLQLLDKLVLASDWTASVTSEMV